MNLGRKVHNVLRGLKQQWGPDYTKAGLWDAEYAGGRWNHCDSTPDALVYSFVARYCREGSILDLGCGSGNTGNELDSKTYRSYVGVDVSAVATQKAAQRSERNGRRKQNFYHAADIMSYVPDELHDVILFRESIYYVPLIRLSGLLRRYRRYLRPDGVFIVDVSTRGTRRGGEIRSLIERDFEIIERHASGPDDDFILVFR